MALQGGGWPLGLQPLNVRIGPARVSGFSRSLSFDTLVSGSPTSSTDSTSSDLDAESTGSSFFRDTSITLGRLIGITSATDFSGASFGRSRRQRRVAASGWKGRRRPRTGFFFSLCARTAAGGGGGAQSLGHFLEAERRGAGPPGRVPVAYELDGAAEGAAAAEPSTLFSSGRVAPPGELGASSDEKRQPPAAAGDSREADGYGGPVWFSCMGCSL